MSEDRNNSVLLVEDEEHIRLVVEYNLKREGFEVYSAEDGQAALEIARKIIPDIILLDWMLPGMNSGSGLKGRRFPCICRVPNARMCSREW